MLQEIKAPQTGQLPTVKGPEFNDRDRLNDLMLTEKYLTMGYNISVFEANDPQLHTDLVNILTQTHEFERKLFQAMFDRGWYTMHVADSAVVGKASKDFENYKSQLPYRTPPPQ